MAGLVQRLSVSHCEGLSYSLLESPPWMANEKQEMVFYNHYDRFSPLNLVLQFQPTPNWSALYLQSGLKQNTDAVVLSSVWGFSHFYVSALLSE